MTRLLSFLFVAGLAASTGVAKQHAAMSVAVEILPPSLTLSVSSARLDFGQIGQNAGPVELHPESGGRSGDAYGTHSLAGILLTGSPGTQVTVQVLPPFSSPRSVTQPYFRHSWARSHECTPAGFVRLPAATTLTEKIGESGCTQIRVGGTLFANQAPQGRYVGEMTVQITQL
ncbi:MAG: hypothetical protein F4Z37_09750 [Rhodothermaceae bacterium]|nr:hypothetical protein [Rhodothermaceae bacterium]MXX59271.1 hypothetical protein [Rhodothermaceae bacterium]